MVHGGVICYTFPFIGYIFFLQEIAIKHGFRATFMPAPFPGRVMGKLVLVHLKPLYYNCACLVFLNFTLTINLDCDLIKCQLTNFQIRFLKMHVVNVKQTAH